MSENSTPEERTEMPTGRRMQKLRDEGAMFQSTDVTVAVSLGTGFAVLCVMWSSLLADMKLTMVKAFMMIADTSPLTVEKARNGAVGLCGMIIPHILVITVVVALFASLSVMLQTNFCVKSKKLHFDFPQMNPMAGIKKIFSIHGFVNVLKALLKLAIILPLAFMVCKSFAPQMVKLVHMTTEQILVFSGTSIRLLFWKIFYILIVFAVADFAWGKYQWLRNNKMTKEEVKDERKAIEGDETTKRKIQQKGFQRVWQRIMQTVPKADVVVTNPTHFAVALKYDRDNMDAPTVVAKGADFLAQRIKEIAREHGVPVLERKPLARALYKSVEVGNSIPRDLFKAVAEVFAYIYKLKNPYGNRGAQTGRA